MADLDTSENRAETIRAAECCLKALRAMEAMGEVDNSAGGNWRQCWEAQRDAISLLVRVSGVNTPYLRGFMHVLGEYVHMVNTAGIPNLDKWMPEIMMDPNEIKAYRKRLSGEDEAQLLEHQHG